MVVEKSCVPIVIRSRSTIDFALEGRCEVEVRVILGREASAEEHERGLVMAERVQTSQPRCK